jgi:hypothetical protein
MKLPNAGILTLDTMCIGCGACHDDWRAWPSHEHRLSLDEARIWRDDALALSDAPYWRPAVHEVTHRPLLVSRRHDKRRRGVFYRQDVRATPEPTSNARAQPTRSIHRDARASCGSGATESHRPAPLVFTRPRHLLQK